MGLTKGGSGERRYEEDEREKREHGDGGAEVWVLELEYTIPLASHPSTVKPRGAQQEQKTHQIPSAVLIASSRIFRASLSGKW